MPGLKIRRLKKDPIPSIFPLFPSYLQTKSTAPRRALKRIHEHDGEDELQSKVPKNETVPSPEMIVEKEHSYCKPKAEVVQVLLEQEISRNEELRRKLNNSNLKNRRLEENFRGLIEVVAELKSKSLVGEKAAEVLKQAASEVPFELFQRLQKKLSQKVPPNQKYPQVLKSFALTLHFYSPRACRFVREVFELTLLKG